MSALTSALEGLVRIVGEANLLTATAGVAPYAVEGQTPLAVAFPGTAEEAAALLRAASEAKLSVMLRGAGQHSYLGAPPAPIGLTVSLARLDQIVEYDPEDLTVTAQAGISLQALQKTVAEHRQMLPLDPPGPEPATLGGIVSANLSGPMRMRYGSPRDLVIGMRLALSSGHIIKTGGRTVKNVAGYDIGKLFVGSLGSLGAILEITTRLIPLPEAEATLLTALAPKEAAEIAAWLINSRLEPMSCEIINHAAAKRLGPRLPVTLVPGHYALLVGVSGEAETIARQAREIGERAAHCRRLDGEDSRQMWRWARGLVYPAVDNVQLRVSAPLASLPDLLALVSSYQGWTGVARAGDGLVYASAPAHEGEGSVRAKLAALREKALSLGGFAVLESSPAELKRAFPVWGEIANLDLMRELKRSYDPAGVLGCSRLPV